MKANNINGIIHTFDTIPSTWKNHLGFNYGSTQLWESEGFYDVVIPSYNSTTQRLSAIYFDSTNKVFTYSVINKTAAELEEDLERIAEQGESALSPSAIKELLRLVVSHSAVPDAQMYKFHSIYPMWRPGVALAINDKVQYNEKLYKVIQAHTTQVDWAPDVALSLFTRYTSPDEIPEWVQPLGAPDAYQIGARVTHDGFIWENTVANNVWEPGVYGWTKIT